LGLFLESNTMSTIYLDKEYIEIILEKKMIEIIKESAKRTFPNL
jgi:hypothetical protein